MTILTFVPPYDCISSFAACPAHSNFSLHSAPSVRWWFEGVNVFAWLSFQGCDGPPEVCQSFMNCLPWCNLTTVHVLIRKIALQFLSASIRELDDWPMSCYRIGKRVTATRKGSVMLLGEELRSNRRRDVVNISRLQQQGDRWAFW